MDIILDIVNLIFAFVGIYFTFLFILLFLSNQKKLLKRPKIKSFPSVSIIIPAHNEEETIAETIENVKKLEYPKKKEIIVVDDESADKTFEIAKKYRNIKVLRKKRGGKASALNFGIKQAKGEIVVCIDSDSYPEKDALLKTIPFFEKNVAAVTTSVIVKNAKGVLERLQELEYIMVAWSRKLFEYLDAIYVTPGPMSLYRRDVLQKLGGFDEKNLTEDIEIAWRLMKHNYKIKMALDAKVYTHVPKTIKSWWHQRNRWNIGGLQTTAKYFNLFLKKEFGNIGTFLLPFFSLSYALSIVGIFLMFYVGFVWARYLIGAYMFGFNPIGLFLFNFVPDIFVVLAITSLLLTALYIKINFRTMKRVIEFPKKFRDILLYVFIYIGIFIFNLLHSSIKFIRKKYEW
jgi:cellulose synthase/poly-beta-1,6-N-acetylglucosamine synthase-like glycosyltransferase